MEPYVNADEVSSRGADEYAKKFANPCTHNTCPYFSDEFSY
jgi:hypothetical protein